MDELAMEKTKSAFLMKIGERLVWFRFVMWKYLQYE